LGERQLDKLEVTGSSPVAPMPAEPTIRRATPEDAPDVARLLHEFNTEYDEFSPGVDVLTDRARSMIANGEMTVFLGGEGPDGIAEVRYRRSIWSGELDAYLEELYVAPERRGEGIGRALLEAVMDAARDEGATHIDLGTSENDTAALGLYESAGFTNREGDPESGPRMLYYEREL
jgi:ribosomal protein S18 acetylase RimI-like enzyme